MEGCLVIVVGVILLVSPLCSLAQNSTEGEVYAEVNSSLPSYYIIEPVPTAAVLNSTVSNTVRRINSTTEPLTTQFDSSTSSGYTHSEGILLLPYSEMMTLQLMQTPHPVPTDSITPSRVVVRLQSSPLPDLLPFSHSLFFDRSEPRISRFFNTPTPSPTLPIHTTDQQVSTNSSEYQPFLSLLFDFETTSILAPFTATQKTTLPSPSGVRVSSVGDYLLLPLSMTDLPLYTASVTTVINSLPTSLATEGKDRSSFNELPQSSQFVDYLEPLTTVHLISTRAPSLLPIQTMAASADTNNITETIDFFPSTTLTLFEPYLFTSSAVHQLQQTSSADFRLLESTFPLSPSPTVVDSYTAVSTVVQHSLPHNHTGLVSSVVTTPTTTILPKSTKIVPNITEGAPNYTGVPLFERNNSATHPPMPDSSSRVPAINYLPTPTLAQSNSFQTTSTLSYRSQLLSRSIITTPENYSSVPAESTSTPPFLARPTSSIPTEPSRTPFVTSASLQDLPLINSTLTAVQPTPSPPDDGDAGSSLLVINSSSSSASIDSSRNTDTSHNSTTLLMTSSGGGPPSVYSITSSAVEVFVSSNIMPSSTSANLSLKTASSSHSGIGSSDMTSPNPSVIGSSGITSSSHSGIGSSDMTSPNPSVIGSSEITSSSPSVIGSSQQITSSSPSVIGSSRQITSSNYPTIPTSSQGTTPTAKYLEPSQTSSTLSHPSTHVSSEIVVSPTPSTCSPFDSISPPFHSLVSIVLAVPPSDLYRLQTPGSPTRCKLAESLRDTFRNGLTIKEGEEASVVRGGERRKGRLVGKRFTELLGKFFSPQHKRQLITEQQYTAVVR